MQLKENPATPAQLVVGALAALSHLHRAGAILDTLMTPDTDEVQHGQAGEAIRAAEQQVQKVIDEIVCRGGGENASDPGAWLGPLRKAVPHVA